MKKTLKTICAIGGLLLVTGCTTQLAVAENLQSQNSTVPLQERYDLYETLTIPTHSFTLSTETVTANGTIIFPDGSSYNSQTVTLTQAGKYEVRYSATSSKGQELFHSQTFVVYKPLFEYTNTSSSSVSRTVPQFCKSYCSAKGVYVTLAKGDTLTINAPIDLSNTTKLDRIVEGFVTPLVQGSFDFSNLNFTLTDCENPDVYLTIIVNGQPSAQTYAEYSYWRAGGQNQTLTGKYTSSSGDVQYQTKGILGTLSLLPFHAAHNAGKMTPTPINPETEPFYFCYDAEDVAIHVAATTATKYPDSTKCADMDNAAYFPDHLWTGFPSKRAYLSISGGKFQGSAARFCLTSVKDVDFSQEYLVDEDGPIISVDEKYNVMPEGMVGVKYSIPAATAYDAEQKSYCTVDTKVVYNYGTTNPTNVNVSNGKFVPERNGNYSIVYTSQDVYGNVGEKVLPVHVGNNIDEITFDLPTLSDSLLAGETIEIGEAKNIQGGVGFYETEVTVTDTLGTVTVDEDTYTPRVIGDNIVTYMVTDYLGNNSAKSKTISIKENSKPIIQKIEKLDETYLTEYESTLPLCTFALSEGNNVVTKTADVNVIDNSGSRTYSPSKTNLFTLYGNNVDKTAKIQFVYNSEVLQETEVALVESKTADGYLNMPNYFSGTGFEASSYTKGSVGGVLIESTQSETNWEFFNPITARDASIIMKKTADSSTFGFDHMDISFTDGDDASCSLTIHIYETYFKIGPSSTKYEIDLLSNDAIELSLSNDVLYFNSVEFEIESFDDGTSFTYFPSERVYVSAYTDGPNSGYVIAKMSNFLLYKPTDNVLPDYALTGDYGGSFGLGSDYVIYSLVCNDVVKPYSCAYLTVTVNGEFVTSQDGTVLNKAPADSSYVITLSKLGTYNFVYSFYGETSVFSYAVYSVDDVAPTLNITSECPTTVALNSTITIPTFEYSDDNTPNEKMIVIVSVLNPSGYDQLMSYTSVDKETGAYTQVTNATTVLARYQGTYKIKINVIDEAGNSTIKIIDIIVK